MLLLAILLFITIIFAVVSKFYVSFKVELKKTGEEHTAEVRLTVHSGLPEIRVGLLEKALMKRLAKIKAKPLEVLKTPRGKKNRPVLKYLKKKVIIKDLKVDIQFGTGEANTTGILTGVLWSVAGNAVSYILNNFSIMRKDIAITPHFNEERLDIYITCIFKLQIVHIITACTIALAGILKKKLRYGKILKADGG